MTDLHVYDTTLRDGAQQEGLNLSIADKLAIAALLDELGVGFIEGGWPGANPKDTEFFARAQRELSLRNATLTAFGATRRAGTVAADDPQVRALIDSGASVVTLVAKAHVRHVELALRTTAHENLAMVRDTVGLLTAEGRRVFLDAEHFFDGYRSDRDYAIEVIRTAMEAGAELVALCDTNGGMLPHEVSDIVADVMDATKSPLGIHCHNDTGCAVANSIAAIRAGATHFQGTVNGYGERTGNADLLSVIANMQLKEGLQLLSEVTNVPPYSRQPYVGASAFAHKAGLHASAIKVDPDLYQHTDPQAVGNDMRMLVSGMAGRASIELKARELGFDLSGEKDLLSRIVKRVKDLEAQGWTFEAADASFDLLLREELGSRQSYFRVESWRVITDHTYAKGDPVSEATVKLWAGGQRVVVTAEGNGPVDCLDRAIRQALSGAYPELAKIELIDFKVRLFDAAHGTDATTRVLMEHSDGVTSWDTVGVAPNIVEASWVSLTDGITYGLMRRGVEVRPSGWPAGPLG